jgi:cysteine synthase A
MHGKIYNNITELIGNTPILALQKLPKGLGAQVALKLEFFNPMSSVKDRMAFSMIQAALQEGKIKPETVVIEPTSGNTGIGLAFVCASLGIKLTIVMPETMSLERRMVLKMLGAQLVLTPGTLGMPGAVKYALALAENTPGSFVPQQFENPANPEIHFKTTSEEIWVDTSGKIDIFVSGVGTGGTITGVGRALKAKNPKIQVYAVEPEESAVLSGEKPGPHKIQGIGAGFVPVNLDRTVVDGILKVSSQQAIDTARQVILSEGIPLGISSGATTYAALELAKRPENKGKLIVAIAASNLERYLSTFLTEHIRAEVATLPVVHM